MTVAQEISTKLLAIDNCRKSGNTEWEGKHLERLQQLIRDTAPSGSGFDNGTELRLEASDPQKLVFATSFHHMDEHGSYCGWTDHEVIVKPCLWSGFSLRITGRNRNEIKEYIHECFSSWLGQKA